MKIYTGIIDEISDRDPYGTGHNKRYVKLGLDGRQSVYIEFKGRLLSLLEKDFSVNDSVSVATEHVGSKSARNVRFNNIYAKGIDKVNLAKTV